MNTNQYYGYVFRFKRKTKIDLWTAIQKEGLSTGYYFETQDDLVELSRTNDVEFIALYNKVERKLASKGSKLSDQKVTYAIAISLFNSNTSTPKIRTKDTYISKLFITQDSGREILASYDKYMSNPLAFIVDNDNMYKSLLRGKELHQIDTFTKNGVGKQGRINGAFATVQQYNQLFIESVQVELYHPTVWHLLKEKELQEYSHLFTKAKEICQRWIGNSTQKRQKTQGE